MEVYFHRFGKLLVLLVLMEELGTDDYFTLTHQTSARKMIFKACISNNYYNNNAKNNSDFRKI